MQRVHPRKQRVVLGALGRIGEPVRDLVVFGEQRARIGQPGGHRVEHRLPGGEFRLLRHIDRHEVLLPRDEAVVGFRQIRDDLQQRRLAGAVAADEPDALAGFEREVRVIEQRDVAERELRAGNGIKRHGEDGGEKIGSAHCTGGGARRRYGTMAGRETRNAGARAATGGAGWREPCSALASPMAYLTLTVMVWLISGPYERCAPSPNCSVSVCRPGDSLTSVSV